MSSSASPASSSADCPLKRPVSQDAEDPATRHIVGAEAQAHPEAVAVQVGIGGCRPAGIAAGEVVQRAEGAGRDLEGRGAQFRKVGISCMGGSGGNRGEGQQGEQVRLRRRIGVSGCGGDRSGEKYNLNVNQALAPADSRRWLPHCSLDRREDRP